MEIDTLPKLKYYTLKVLKEYKLNVINIKETETETETDSIYISIKKGVIRLSNHHNKLSADKCEVSITFPIKLEYIKIIINQIKLKTKNKMKEQELTFGQKTVGLTFNPSGREDVNKAKQLSADLIDLVMDNHEEVSKDNNVSWIRNVLKTAAINALITAQMAVVKVLTWQD
jgi:hypothetical protein